MPEPGGAEEPEAPAAAPTGTRGLGAAWPFLFLKGLRRSRGAQERVAVRPGGHSWTAPTHASVPSSRKALGLSHGVAPWPRPRRPHAVCAGPCGPPAPPSPRPGLGAKPPCLDPCCFRASAVEVPLLQAYSLMNPPTCAGTGNRGQRGPFLLKGSGIIGPKFGILNT